MYETIKGSGDYLLLALMFFWMGITHQRKMRLFHGGIETTVMTKMKKVK